MKNQQPDTHSQAPLPFSANNALPSFSPERVGLLLHDLLTNRTYRTAGVGLWLENLIPVDGISLSDWEAPLPQSSREKLRFAVQQVQEGQTAFVEYEYPFEQGIFSRLQHYMAPLLSPDGQIRTALGFLIRPNDAEGGGSEQHLSHKILNSMIEAVIVTDPQGIIQFWNPAAETLYGYLAAEVIGKPIYQVTVSEHTQKEAQIIMDLLRSGRSWSGEFMVKDRSGRRFLAHVTDTPLQDVHGTLTGIIGISHDTSRKASLQENTLFMADVMRQMHVPIFVTDDNMLVLEWSWSLEQISGWREMEMVNASIFEVIIADGIEEFLEQVLRSKSSRKIFEIKALLARKSGNHLPVELSVSRVFSKDFVPIGVLWSVRVST